MRKLLLFTLTAIIFLTGCSYFLDSPFSTSLRIQENKLNDKSIAEIAGLPNDGTTRIALFSDPHQNYRDLESMVDEINRQSDIDFIVCLGDITNLAYNFEFEQFVEEYRRLKKPRIVVPGNHDLVGAGQGIFKKLFGVDRFSFVFNNIRFVGFNSANWEDPDNFSPLWLLNEVQSSAEQVIVFSHVQLYDTERYMGSDRSILDQVLVDANLYMQANGHNHSFSLSQPGGAIRLQVPRVEHVQWMILELNSTQNRLIQYRGGEVVGVFNL